jgi:acetolactate synthase-1/2/3 large subunit
MGAREVMEEEVPPVAIDRRHWQPTAPAALPDDAVAMLARALATAKRPLVVTSYLGRNPRAVGELVRLCDRLAVGVLESVPNYLNLPTHHPLYQGNQWNQPRQNSALAAADLVLVLDSDVPWIPAVSRPAADAAIYHIDIDPLKQQMPLWYIPALASFRADAETALGQINRALEGIAADPGLVADRRAHWTDRHAARDAELAALEAPRAELTGEYLTACVRAHADDETIVLNEGISHYHTIIDHMARDRPGSLFTSGGGSLGWNGGAALGAKLAFPDRTVMALTGDGSYMFSVPSSVHWMARHYKTPFLQVVYNNRGWKSPKLSTLAVHPDGYASRANEIGVSFDPPPDYAGIAAAAGGALALTVKTPEEVAPALERAMHAVRVEKRAAVIDAWVPHL